MQMPETAAERAAYMNSCAWMWFATAGLSIANSFWKTAPSPEEKVKYEAEFWDEIARMQEQPGLYETATGCCGAQITFAEPLTEWTLVRCRRCGHFIEVR